MTGALAVGAILTLVFGLWPLSLLCGAMMFVTAGSNRDLSARTNAMASASTKTEQALEIGNTAAHGCVWSIVATVVAVGGSMAALLALGFGG